MTETLNPRLDVVSKLLFADERNRDLLVSLLNALLRPKHPIREVEVVNPEIRKEGADDRGLTLDVLAVHEDGTRTDVEMQSVDRGTTENRALYHWARLYREGLHRGEDYAALHPCRVVFILGYALLAGERMHSTFRVKEVHDGTELSDALEIHTVELPKLASTKEVEPAEQAAYDWARFLAALTDEERDRLAMANPDISKAKEALERLSEDPKARMLAQWREDELKLQRVALATAEQRGHEAGKAEGEAFGRAQGLQQAIESLCEVLEISLDEPRRARVEQSDIAALESVLSHLRSQRSWPED